MVLSVESYRVPNIPPAAYYVRDFITEEEEQLLLRKVNETPLPKWKNMTSGRRLQYWGGTMSKNGTLVPEPIPDFLTAIAKRVDECLELGGRPLGVNQVLINEYQPDQGISPHEDGAAFEPLVATISLGSYTILDLHHYLHPTDPSPPMTGSSGSSADNPGQAEGEEGQMRGGESGKEESSGAMKDKASTTRGQMDGAPRSEAGESDSNSDVGRGKSVDAAPVSTSSATATARPPTSESASVSAPTPPPAPTPTPTPTPAARPIAAIPLASLLIQPRSLLVLADSLYSSHLHGIRGQTEDIIPLAPPYDESSSQSAVGIETGPAPDNNTSITSTPTHEGAVPGRKTRVANTKLAGLDLGVGEWIGHRGVRTSLTFRRAKKVVKGGVFKMGPGGMRRG